MLNNKDPMYINSKAYLKLLELLRLLMCTGEGETKFDKNYLEDDFLSLLINLLDECFNKETLYNLLMILAEISRDHDIRKKLMELQIFSQLTKFYTDASGSGNTQLLFHLFILFGRFTREVSFKIQFYESLEIGNNFIGLFEPFKFENEEFTSLKIKLAVLQIIRNTVLNGPSRELRRTLAGASYLNTMLKNCLEEGDDKLKEYALDILVSLYDLIAEGAIYIEDLLVDFDKIFLSDTEAIQEKLFLFVSWSLLSNTIGINFITRNFIIKAIDSGFAAATRGNFTIFQKSYFIIFLVLLRDKKDKWSSNIMSL